MSSSRPRQSRATSTRDARPNLGFDNCQYQLQTQLILYTRQIHTFVLDVSMQLMLLSPAWIHPPPYWLSFFWTYEHNQLADLKLSAARRCKIVQQLTRLNLHFILHLQYTVCSIYGKNLLQELRLTLTGVRLHTICSYSEQMYDSRHVMATYQLSYYSYCYQGRAENRNSVQIQFLKTEPSKNMTSIQRVFRQKLHAICHSNKSE